MCILQIDLWAFGDVLGLASWNWKGLGTHAQSSHSRG